MDMRVYGALQDVWLTLNPPLGSTFTRGQPVRTGDTQITDLTKTVSGTSHAACARGIRLRDAHHRV